MKRIYMAIISILCSIGIAIAISHAWFVNGYDVDPLATGSSAEAYYHSGTGTQSDPFIITTPRHLYNLAWLQYMGRYNADVKTGTNFPATYFKLGTSANGSLDMTGWPLPPIGTAKFPFIGNFNGNGWTISNLTTTNNFSEFGNKHPSGINSSNFEQENCGTIGFFGAIGAYNDSVISNTDTTTGCTYDEDNNTAFNFYLNNTNVHTNISTTIIGAVAGYVNAELAQVGVIQPHLNIQTSATSKLSPKTSNLSDFAVVGYAEDEYTTQKTKNSTIIYNPTYDYAHFNFKGMGSQADWGGSMNFADVFTRFRLNNNPKSQGANFNYVHQEIVQSNGNILQDTQSSTALNNVNDWFDNTTFTPSKYYDPSHPENGEYLSWYRYNTSEVDAYNYVIAMSKDVYTITRNGTVKTGYKIHDDDGNYLTINTSSQVSNTTEENEAVIWLCEGNKLYTFNEKIYSTTIQYYLSGTTSLNTALTTSSPSTNWYWDNTYSTFYYDYSNTRYYLKYYNGAWCVTPLYKISDNNGNYIKIGGTNNNTRVVNTDANDASIWTFSTNGTNPSGTIATISGSYTRYLNINNGNLVTSTGTMNWSNSGSGLYNGTNYIHFINGYWVATSNPLYKIGYNSSHYLSKTGADATSDDAALWTFNNTLATNGGNGTISMLLNGTTNYLRNNGGTLQVSTTPTTWYSEGGNKLYSIDGNQKYYLEYNNGWTLNILDFYIKDQNNNYLTYNNATSVTNATSAMTLWHFSNGSATYPNGTITCTQGGNTYYLDVNGTNVILSNAANTTWLNDGGGLYCVINGVNNYLVYDSYWKLVTYAYKIHSGNNYLSLSGNDIIYTNEASATEWTFSNSGTNPSGTISSNNRYLYLDNNGQLATTGTAGNALSFNNAGAGLYDNNNNYIQFYNNKWICGKAFNLSFNGTYLGYNGSLGNTASVWFYNTNAANPQGYIYTIYNNQPYYLNAGTGTSLSCTTTRTTSWTNTGSGLYTGNKYIQYVNGTWIYETLKYHYVSNGTYYLTSTNGTNFVNNQTNISGATLWEFSNAGTNPSGYMSATINGDIKYIYPERYGITINNNQTYELENSNGKLYCYYNSYYFYIRYNNNSWTGGRNRNNFDAATTLTFTQPLATTTTVTANQSINVNHIGTTNVTTNVNETINTLTISNTNVISTINIFSYTLETSIVDGYNLISTKTSETSEFSYIPLNCKYDNNKKITQTVDSSNTGYIVGGSYYTGTPKGDYRVSRYPLSNIQSSYNYTANPTTWNSDAIYTVGASGYNYIGSSTYPESKYSKYVSSKDQLLNTLKQDSSNVYGLHFMSASININHLVVAPKVIINGETYTNYQLPEDSIDFTLASKGYINFFAGTYFNGNDSFFSLHQIIRNSNNEITAIKHISKIYAANSTYGLGYNSVDFIYQYEDNSWSGTNVSGDSHYTLAFDKTWIENPETLGSDLYNNYRNYLWYFEIPVNKGEYALGSVNGGTGAYLIYLDIGANASPVDRTIITQQSTTTQDTLTYVNGIQILATGSTFTSDVNSCVAIIKNTNSGAVTITRTGDTVAFTASSTLDSSYKDENITLSGANLAPTATSITTSKVLRYVDYNRATDKLYYTTIYNNGTSNTSYDCYRIDNMATGAKTAISYTGTDADEWGILSISDGSGVPTAFSNHTNIANLTYGTTAIIDYYSYIDTTALGTYNQTIDMTVVADASVVPPADGQYVYEHSYHISGDSIVMAPNALLVYIGPTLKNSATISGPTNNVVTVTIGSYVFTFNANAMNNTNKTVTIYVASS